MACNSKTNNNRHIEHAVDIVMNLSNLRRCMGPLGDLTSNDSIIIIIMGLKKMKVIKQKAFNFINYIHN